MGRYNLLDEKWLLVIRKIDGVTEKVSLKELFTHAAEYEDLAGEMKTQDFAILRVLLAVVETVFSRVDSEGKPYPMMEIDPKTFQQQGNVNYEDFDDKDPLFDTWLSLWKRKSFPQVVQDYLEAWRDHFNLFDDKYPFYQVTKEEMNRLAAGGGQFYGKNLNRTISESNNKVALFAPASEEQKDRMTYDQLARWLITLQGYTGTGDKKKVNNTKLPCSKGWLYDLGGIYLKGHNLYETLLLNCILSTEFDGAQSGDELKIQIPCWERSPSDMVAVYFDRGIDNRAALYTGWSRAVSFDQNFEEGAPFSCFIAKLPDVQHANNFLESMTCWKWNKDGDSKNQFTPKKHSYEVAMWRSFNVLMGVEREEGEHFRRPEIISWYHHICKDRSMSALSHLKITICGVSMRDDGNATSWSPVDEITDELQMETAVLVDDNRDGWIWQINTLVGDTKKRIDYTLGILLQMVSQIRGYEKTDYHLKNTGLEEMYREIDGSFREWIGGIQDTDVMNDKALEWYDSLEMAIRRKGRSIFESATLRDLKGIQQDGRIINIATEYNAFMRRVGKAFHPNACWPAMDQKTAAEGSANRTEGRQNG